jgi:hypothetical protein
MRTKTDDDEKSTVLGNPISIIIVLQRLALGDANAEVALLKVKEATRAQGTTVDLAPSRVDHQLVLSLKRRMVSEKTSAAILSFCAKLLDETPHLLLDLPDALAVGTLSALTASRLLAGYTSGLSALRPAPYISASQLLNALCTRLTASPTVLDNLDIRDIFSQALATSCSVLANAASPRSSSSIGATTVGEVVGHCP